MSNQRSTLYVGNLSEDVTEHVLLTVFSNFGTVVNCKILRDPAGRTEPYAFLEYGDYNTALIAMNSMKNIRFLGRELKISWAASSSNQSSNTNKGDGRKGVQVFVGDLSPDVDESILREAFAPVGRILDARIMRFQDGRSRGYGFVSLESEADADRAIKDMDKAWIMNRTIRCNWASRKVGLDGDDQRGAGYTPKPYDVVFNEASMANCTVYVGGISSGLTEELLRTYFEEFGKIEDVRCFPDKGFAFLSFDTHESAARAISKRHGFRINNFIVKCWWGKENFVWDKEKAGQETAHVNGNPYYNATAQPMLANGQYSNLSPEQYAQYCQQYYANYYQQQQQAHATAASAAYNQQQAYHQQSASAGQQQPFPQQHHPNFQHQSQTLQHPYSSQHLLGVTNPPNFDQFHPEQYGTARH